MQEDATVSHPHMPLEHPRYTLLTGLFLMLVVEDQQWCRTVIRRRRAESSRQIFLIHPVPSPHALSDPHSRLTDLKASVKYLL
jgi:hypothetical protein